MNLNAFSFPVSAPLRQRRIQFPLTDMLSKPYRLALNSFQRKVEVNIERDRFIVKTAEDPVELENALKLRHDVFFRELLGKRQLFDIDMDRFDFIADHLLVIDRRTGDIAGTYRLISSVFSRQFYSASEFDIRQVTRLPGIKTELGRACTHPRYRNGMTVALLWRGIMEYMRKTESDFLFGCSSIKTTAPEKIIALRNYFRDTGCLSVEAVRVNPRLKFRIPKHVMNAHPAVVPADFDPSELVPPLLSSYIKAGAKVCGDPALDRSFKCVDFFTLLNTRTMTRSVERKFSS